MKIIPITEKKEIVHMPYYATGEGGYSTYVNSEYLVGNETGGTQVWLPHEQIELPVLRQNKTYKQNSYQLLDRLITQAKLPSDHELTKLLSVIKKHCVDLKTGYIRTLELPRLSPLKIEDKVFDNTENYNNATGYECSPQAITTYAKQAKMFEGLISVIETASDTLLKYHKDFAEKHKVGYLKDIQGVEIDLAYLAKTIRPSIKFKNLFKKTRQWLEWAQSDNNTISIELDKQSVLMNSFNALLEVEELKPYPKCYTLIHLENEEFSNTEMVNNTLFVCEKPESIEVIYLTANKLKENAKRIAYGIGKKSLLVACYKNGQLDEVSGYDNSKTNQENLAFTTTLLEKHKLKSLINPNGMKQRSVDKFKI